MKPGPVFGAMGGAAAYRRAMLADVGLLDEVFFMYLEDVDLAFRAQPAAAGSASISPLRGSTTAAAPAAAARWHRSTTGVT